MILKQNGNFLEKKLTFEHNCDFFKGTYLFKDYQRLDEINSSAGLVHRYTLRVNDIGYLTREWGDCLCATTLNHKTRCAYFLIFKQPRHRTSFSWYGLFIEHFRQSYIANALSKNAAACA